MVLAHLATREVEELRSRRRSCSRLDSSQSRLQTDRKDAPVRRSRVFTFPANDLFVASQMEIRVTRVLGIHATDERFAIAQVLQHIDACSCLFVGCEHFLIIVLERKEIRIPALVVDVVVARFVRHIVEHEILFFVSVIVSIYTLRLLILVKLEIVALVALRLVTIVLEVVELFHRHLIHRSLFQS